MTDWKPIPTDKSEDLDDMFTRIYGVDRRKSITGKSCISCGDVVTEESFRDDISLREYHISGLCQKCQDTVFGAPVDES